MCLAHHEQDSGSLIVGVSLLAPHCGVSLLAPHCWRLTVGVSLWMHCATCFLFFFLFLNLRFLWGNEDMVCLAGRPAHALSLLCWMIHAVHVTLGFVNWYPFITFAGVKALLCRIVWLWYHRHHLTTGTTSQWRALKCARVTALSPQSSHAVQVLTQASTQSGKLLCCFTLWF